MPFLVQVLIVIISVLLAGQISRRLGQPAVLGQLLVGGLLGPALLGWLELTPLIKQMADIGVILLMFIAGLETDFEEIRRNALAALLVATAGVALPFVGGWGTAVLWGYHGITAIFIGVLLVATSVSISVQTLRELGHLRTRQGVTILAAAVLDDVMGILVLSLVLGLAGGETAASSAGGHGTGSMGLLLIKIVAFFVLAGLVGRKLLPKVVRWTSRFEAGTAVLATGIAIALAYAYASEFAGLAGIIGAYFAGLMLGLTEFRGRLLHEVEHTAFAFFVPFFFVSVGLTAQFQGLTGPFLVFVLILTAVAIVTKLVGGTLGALLGGFTFRPALGVGAGMIARGEVGLIVASIGLERGLLTPELYTATVIVSLVTTLVTPPVLKAVFPKKSKNGPEESEG